MHWKKSFFCHLLSNLSRCLEKDFQAIKQKVNREFNRIITLLTYSFYKKNLLCNKLCQKILLNQRAWDFDKRDWDVTTVFLLHYGYIFILTCSSRIKRFLIFVSKKEQETRLFHFYKIKKISAFKMKYK